MIVALLVLIVFILLFGAGVVKGWLVNAAALTVGGGVALILALWLGSYLGEYGLIWVIVIVAALFGLAVLVEDYARVRRIEKLTGRKPGEFVAPPESIAPTQPDRPTRFHSRAPDREARKRLRGR